jgi:NADH:ubiquinone oxidoreductase subunit F (NADH-binding)
MNIITKLKKSGLSGRSGNDFPVWKKWQAIKTAKAWPKYIVCNGSEGEPNVFKDEYILTHYLSEVIEGIKIAARELGAQKSYIYLNKKFYKKFKKSISLLVKKFPAKIFEGKEGYLAGEETSLLNALEGKRVEPRIKPPFPTEQGLWNKPTLINNVETFYWIAKIAKNEYRNEKFYCVSGEVKNPGVFNLPDNYSIKQILQTTNNYSNFPFFVQAGGGAMGEILLPQELNQPIGGPASIIIFDKKKTDVWKLMNKWVTFLMKENCDRCTPCREGLYRLRDLIQTRTSDPKILNDIFSVLERTSLCPFGQAAFTPFKSAWKKLIRHSDIK